MYAFKVALGTTKPEQFFVIALYVKLKKLFYIYYSFKNPITTIYLIKIFTHS